ncbi:twin-arginine translocation signal domain-containing protein [Plantactinospora sp. S1510]|uniref:Twin-arginine translocation signal domain-containing protein n=1 Tax=Plantactinospora alkalitolerans TaxID=2789879 RepID=A0ABS0H4Z8_9ACTN|nr:twin-arginine translocation signal domain-containing protein [Plantactinospora alkalitolerans]MBF9133283.1 twin-arginine translocation signal domain-containing protein [Plantactinospora alkalitolerans]
MTGHVDRRRFLGRAAGTGAAVGALAVGAALSTSEMAEASPTGHGGSSSPVLGTWRGVVTLPHEEEVALFTFLPGGFFLSFAQGIHIATGRWEATGRRTVTFTLWQVLPDDLRGLPHRYNGEVRALHHARVDGDRLTSDGTFRALDIDGNELSRGPVSTRATRFDISTF